MTQQFEHWEVERKESQKREVLRWMSTAGVSQASHHETISDMRTPDTGTWICDNERISSWLSDECPAACLVWLTGKMGAGEYIRARSCLRRFMSLVASELSSTSTE
jgi:hypothetical protein